MGELGSIFEKTEGLRGPDLEHTVTVHRRALGKADGIHVRVPSTFDIEGQIIERHESPHDPKGHVQITLPSELPDGARLRLRGQGGRAENRTPGDLYLQIYIRRGPTRRFWIITAFAIALIGVLAALGMHTFEPR